MGEDRKEQAADLLYPQSYVHIQLKNRFIFDDRYGKSLRKIEGASNMHFRSI
tara:strand:+ start:22679 stop:22834 length:156 start_codon:yes stop_codon:yes gene_type:complete